MPIFQYQAVDATGKAVRGLQQGTSLDQAASALASRGLQVQEIGVASDGFDKPEGGAPASSARVEETSKEEVSGAPPVTPRNRFVTDIAGPVVGKVPLTNLHFFFRQLHAMLNAGVNPAQALETLARQTSSTKLKKVLNEAKEHVIAGRPISAAFQRYPEVFSPLVMSMLRAGEEGGFTDTACRDIADYLQRDLEQRNLIRRETAYPKLVILMAILIIGGANLIIGAVAPGGQQIYSPLTTLSTWFVLGPVLLGLFLYFRVGLHNQTVRQFHDTFVLAIPFIGSMAKGWAMARFGRAFGALYRSGVPLQKGLRLAADASGNEAIRSRIYPASVKLEQGAGIAETMAETRAFDPVVLDMASTGETTGNLDQMLTKVSEYYEDEGSVKAKQLGHIVGVLALLAVAAY
ncbi:MAG: type II secretion system F family protein, partial [Fimbriimonadaceae bacterium]